MAQIIDLLKNSSFEQKMVALTEAVSNRVNDYNINTNKPSINGNILEGNKTNAQLGIPVKVGELANDKNFIDNTTNNLVNYYKKTENYNKTEVNTLINNIITLEIKIVSVLPTADISKRIIYLIPKEAPNEKNIYDEYLNVDGTANGWEKIGDTEVNLSNYYTKKEVDIKNNLLGASVTDVRNRISNVPNVTTNDQTPTYEEATSLQELTSGEKLSVAFGKIKMAIKNLKTIVSLMGTTDISQIGGGTVTGGINSLNAAVAQLNGEAAKLKQTNIFTSRQEIEFSGDVKLVMRSTDADNACYIEAQDAARNRLGLFGYFSGFGGWCANGKPIVDTLYSGGMSFDLQQSQSQLVIYSGGVKLGYVSLTK